MERNLDKGVENSSADFKEEIDYKDACAHAVRYEAQLEQASDGIDSLDKQDHNLEDGNTSDSSIESDTSQGLVLIISYKRKISAKWKELTRLLEIPLNLNQALKWKYICSNPDLVQQQILRLKTIAEDATFVDSHVNVILGKQKIDPDFSKLSKQIEQILLENTDSLVISWFPVSTSFKDEDIYRELCKLLETSEKFNKYAALIDKADAGLIRLVYDENQDILIADLLTETMKNLKEKLRTEYVSSRIVMPGVQWKVFQHFGVSQSVCKMFPLIELACDVVESNDQFILNLLGPMLQVQNAEDWIKDNYLTPYKFENVSLEQLNRLDEFIDVPRILEKSLANQSFTDLFWTVNKFTKLVTYSSRDKLVLQKALTDTSKCLEQSSMNVPADAMSIEETEDMINDLAHFDGLSHNYQCIRMMTKETLLDVKVTGTELDPILKEIAKYLGKHDQLTESKVSLHSGRSGCEIKDADNVIKPFKEIGRNLFEPILTVNDQQTLVKPRERDVQSYHPEFALKRQATNLREYTTNENIKVYDYEANILKRPVDCIVNDTTLQRSDEDAFLRHWPT